MVALVRLVEHGWSLREKTFKPRSEEQELDPYSSGTGRGNSKYKISKMRMSLVCIKNKRWLELRGRAF